MYIKNKNIINTSDISVVVQGAIDVNNTPKCLNSIRKYLPNSEIILSTWKESNTDSLSYDILVENEDCGGFLYDKNISKLNNNNRMILSTQKGLEKANRKYILKLRSDLEIINTNLLKNFNNDLKRYENFKLFKERILAYQIYSLKFEELDDDIKKDIIDLFMYQIGVSLG